MQTLGNTLLQIQGTHASAKRDAICISCCLGPSATWLRPSGITSQLCHNSHVVTREAQATINLLPICIGLPLSQKILLLSVQLYTTIRASVDALCRDDASEISRDPRTNRLQTRRESLARPSKHINNNF